MISGIEISASQVETARDCWRKWAFNIVDRAEPSPELKAAAEHGTGLHEDAERYQKTGASPDPNTIRGREFQALLPYVPRPRVGVAEGEFHLTVSGVPYMGYIDLRARSYDLPTVSTVTDMPLVLDYKSKSDIRRGDRKNVLEGPGDFLNGPQPLLYAVREFVLDPGAPEVMLRWLYSKRLEKVTQKPKAWASDAILGRNEIIDAFGRIVHPIAERAYHLQMAPIEPLTLEPNPATCLRYGVKYACPYMDRCKDVTPAMRLGSALQAHGMQSTHTPPPPATTTGNNMDLLAALKASAAQGTPVAPASTPAVVTMPAPQNVNPPGQPVALGINPPESKSAVVETAKALPIAPAELRPPTLAQGTAAAALINPRGPKVSAVLRAIADLIDG